MACKLSQQWFKGYEHKCRNSKSDIYFHYEVQTHCGTERRENIVT